MTTDKNKVSEPLVSDEWIEEQGDVMSKSIVEFGGTPEQGDQDAETWMGAARCVRYVYEAELSRLRQERDELLGALRPLVGMWIAFTEDDEDDPADISHENAYQTFYKGMSGEWNKARAILSRHKPE